MIRLAYLLCLAIALCSGVYRPVVLMHGIISTSAGMDDIATWLRASFPDIYVVSIEIGEGKDDSFLWPLDRQVEQFCQIVHADEHLRYGFNMLGYSQGSIVARGALERCSLPVYHLITLSGIHQGVFGVPYLTLLPIQFRDLVTNFAYDEPVQNVLSVANYWRESRSIASIPNGLPFSTGLSTTNDRHETRPTVTTC